MAAGNIIHFERTEKRFREHHVAEFIKYWKRIHTIKMNDKGTMSCQTPKEQFKKAMEYMEDRHLSETQITNEHESDFIILFLAKKKKCECSGS